MFSVHLVITGRIDREVREQINREHPEMTVAQWSGQGAIPRAILLKWVHEADAVLYQMRRKTPCFSYGDIRRGP